MKASKKLILFFTIFIGLGAIFGSTMFLLDPKNGLSMGFVLPIMQKKMPFGEVFFQNLIFPGIMLLIVNGISNITAFILILKNKKIGYILGFVFGITLMLWIIIQFYLFYPEVYFIDILYFGFGLIQFCCGYVAYKQFIFHFDENDYKLTKENKKSIVIYFSRTGYTKKLAYEMAESLNSDIIEIETLENIKGFFGFMWCGRFNLRIYPMKIKDINVDISLYDDVYLLTPIWILRMSAPIRMFVNENIDKLNRVHYYTVKFRKGKNKYAYDEAKLMFKDKMVEYHEYSSHFGEITMIC